MGRSGASGNGEADKINIAVATCKPVDREQSDSIGNGGWTDARWQTVQSFPVAGPFDPPLWSVLDFGMEWCPKCTALGSGSCWQASAAPAHTNWRGNNSSINWTIIFFTTADYTGPTFRGVVDIGVATRNV